jgi:hypothetical protein
VLSQKPGVLPGKNPQQKCLNMSCLPDGWRRFAVMVQAPAMVAHARLPPRHLLAQRPGRAVGLVLHCVSGIYKTPI